VYALIIEASKRSIGQSYTGHVRQIEHNRFDNEGGPVDGKKDHCAVAEDPQGNCATHRNEDPMRLFTRGGYGSVFSLLYIYQVHSVTSHSIIKPDRAKRSTGLARAILILVWHID
jgi:hypothetical protein